MGRKYELSDNPLTRQGVLCQSERRGDSPRVIDNPLTCQGALYVIEAKGKEIVRVLSTRTLITDPSQRCKIVIS